MAQADTIVLKLPIEILKNMSKRSKTLLKIFKQEAKVKTMCDFTTFLTYNQELSTRQLRTKFKRAVRRQIQITRHEQFMQKMQNLAAYKDNMASGTIEKDHDFFEEDTDIKPVDLSQRAQRHIESKLFALLTNS